ncbi:MAG: tetratricopeptide repeat protein, partial [Chitinophagaceae bacterium]|nr:tetratricopeptide repeat protein [Chitinophagaceae bacterium]
KLGGIYEATGDWQNALKNYESQLNLFLEIYASSPENLSYKNGLAISYIKLGIIQLNENILNKAAAKELLEKAFQLYQEIRAMAPEIHEYEKNYTWLDNKLKELM